MKGFLRIMDYLDRKGQNLIEYAFVASIVIAAVFVMSTYVFRSVQSTQQMIQKEAIK